MRIHGDRRCAEWRDRGAGTIGVLAMVLAPLASFVIPVAVSSRF